MPIPNTVLSSTDQKATDSVSWKAKIISGCLSASSTGARPLANVTLATRATGHTTRKNRYATTISRRIQRVRDRRRTGTPLPAPAPAGTGSSTRALAMAGHPSGDDVERDDHHERDHEQHRGHGSSLGQLVTLDIGQDPDRGDLRPVRQVARDQHQGAVLADPASKGQRGAGSDRRNQARQDDPAKGREPAR